MKLVEDAGVIMRKEYDTLSRDEQFKYWKIGRNKFKLISEMDSEHLQNAFCYAQTQGLIYHNKLNTFNELEAQIEAEAGRRGLSLSDIDTEYHKNIRRYKSKVKDVKKCDGATVSDKI